MRYRLLFVVMVLALMASIAFAQDENYTVQPGDSITSIANAFDVDADAILIRNNLIDPNRIQVGQVLIIPTGAVTVPLTHVVGAGETLNDLAIRYNTTVEALRATNGFEAWQSIFVGQVVILPATGGPATFPRTYLLDIGDTLRNVAERFGVTWENVAAYNNIANPNYVQAGTVITIPAFDWTPPPAPPAPTPVPATGGPTVPAPATPVVVNITYVVQQGDMLSTIAQRFNTTAEAIRAYNNITDSRAIFAGDVLIIPPTGGVPATPVTQPVPTGANYVVNAGDTLFAIASAYGVNVYDLAQTNGILNLNSIYAGQSLRIPGR